jgi:hypothetical protein
MKILVINQEMPHQGIADQHLAHSKSTAPVHVGGNLAWRLICPKMQAQVFSRPGV